MMQKVMNKKWFLAMAVSVLLVACSEDNHPAQTDSEKPASSVFLTLVTHVVSIQPLVKFDLDLQGNGCGTTTSNLVAVVHWDVKVPNINNVRVMVGDKVFADGGKAGIASTGAWVNKGSEFKILDMQSGKNLAELKVDTQSCSPNPKSS